LRIVEVFDREAVAEALGVGLAGNVVDAADWEVDFRAVAVPESRTVFLFTGGAVCCGVD